LDLVPERGSLAFQETREAPLILLDTNALLWLHSGHRRTRALLRRAGRLYASPASLLEIQMLLETGRVRLRGAATVAQIVRDDRWLLDDPSAAAWFERTLAIGWTRDPFDRLLVAHAALRSWRLATGDEALITRLGESRTLAL